MLPLLAGLLVAKAPSDDALPAFTSEAQVAEALAPLGYTFVPSTAKDGPDSLTHEGVTIWAGLARTAGDSVQGTPDTFPFVLLSLEMAVPGVPEMGKPWSPKSAGSGTVPVAFVSHLGGTVTETAQVGLGKGTTKAGIKRALDEFWRKGRLFAKAHGTAFAAAPAFDASKPGFDDAAVLHRADLVSFSRALQVWGWAKAETPGYASQGWMLPTSLDGGRVWLRQAVRGTEPLSGRIEIARYDAKATDRDPWAERKSGDAPMPAAYWAPDGMHLPLASEPLDLAKGVTLGELRRRVEAFVARS